MARNEYPRPSFVRENWLSLNGQWDFEIGGDKLKPENVEYTKKIEVPFCPESKLSGIEYKDFMTSVWYKREVEITADNLKGAVILHIDACDYETFAYVNGKEAGRHKGGYTPMEFEISDKLTEGKNIITIHAKDDTKSNAVPSGKQSSRLESYGCSYTRTTGIWQSVWLEFCDKTYITTTRIDQDIDNSKFRYQGYLSDSNADKAEIEVSYKGEIQAEQTVDIDKKKKFFAFPEIKIENMKLWDVLKPEIYDIKVKILRDGEVADEVKTYTGFRKIELKDGKFWLNSRPVFLRNILDQGFYPDGIYTAPEKEDLEKDIDIAISFGFNGARLHQKVFEPWYLYYADMKGYLVWDEFPNWGVRIEMKRKKVIEDVAYQWEEVMFRDFNRPSVIGWCPLNECWTKDNFCDNIGQRALFKLTKEIDSVRPCVGSSGGPLFYTDIDDYHDYSKDVDKLKELFHNHPNGILKPNAAAVQNKLRGAGYLTPKQLHGMPIFLSEFGGIGLAASPENEDGSWSYVSESTEETYVDHYCALVKAILESDLMGMCYTQLTDVEQEQNGLVTYDRKDKISEAGKKRIYEANTAKAFVEE